VVGVSAEVLGVVAHGLAEFFCVVDFLIAEADL
jgi:hypothetical protein